jgi:hypothetical protein
MNENDRADDRYRLTCGANLAARVTRSKLARESNTKQNSRQLPFDRAVMIDVSLGGGE